MLQVYPENIQQRELILRSAMHVGFSGGVVVDYPHRYAKDLLGQSCDRIFFLHVEMVAVKNNIVCLLADTIKGCFSNLYYSHLSMTMDLRFSHV